MFFLLAVLVRAEADDVTYDEVLANPDDLKLNYLYAQQQVIKGDLEQASAALERVLLLQPNWDTARLFYALVLYRLDDMEGAKRELTILSDRPLGPSQAREVKKYLALASSKSKTTRISGRVSTGFRVDSNPDLTTSSQNDLNGDPLDTDKRVDGAFVAGTRIRLEHDLPGGQGNYAFIQTNSNLNQQFQVSEANYLTGGVKAGASFFFEDLKLTPYGTADIFTLDGQVYRSEYGGGLYARYSVNPKFSVFAGGEGVFQNYQVVSTDSVGSARNGWLGTASGGFAVRTSESNKFTARVKGYLKNARNDSYSYDGIEIAATNLMLLGKGQYILATASYRWLDYDQPDPNYSTTVTRKDRLFKGRLAYGLPLDVILENIDVTPPEATANINFQVGVNYLNQDSNIPNFDADSVSADIMLIKRFGG
ncbi:tetratricopeptide repeat protein [Hoeflea sp. TYP-13]|uniref:tetratricopeptide repeat protein n=1 Tax=Hoeflea sp. TYP-13 TaxID=3230023 RepID=UPI0034C5B716